MYQFLLYVIYTHVKTHIRHMLLGRLKTHYWIKKCLIVNAAICMYVCNYYQRTRYNGKQVKENVSIYTNQPNSQQNDDLLAPEICPCIFANFICLFTGEREFHLANTTYKIVLCNVLHFSPLYILC